MEYFKVAPGRVGPAFLIRYRARIRSRCAFWQAFKACQKGRHRRALSILEREYFRKGSLSRQAYRYELYNSQGLYRLNDTSRLSWLEILVLINDQVSLCQIARKAPARRIDIIDACLSFGREIIPLHLIRPPDRDWDALLRTYTIEWRLLHSTQETTEQLKGWLEQRCHRAHMLRNKQRDPFFENVPQ